MLHQLWLQHSRTVSAKSEDPASQTKLKQHLITAQSRTCIFTWVMRDRPLTQNAAQTLLQSDQNVIAVVQIPQLSGRFTYAQLVQLAIPRELIPSSTILDHLQSFHHTVCTYVRSVQTADTVCTRTVYLGDQDCSSNAPTPSNALPWQAAVIPH